MDRLTKLWRPAHYQDGRKTLGYFEGWYFKACAGGGASTVALIPGVSVEPTGERHAFLQVMRGDGGTRWYDFPWEAFSSSSERFGIRVGDCVFSDNEIVLDVDDGTSSAHGRLELGAPAPWPVRLLSPGIMGPFRFAPFMECYHGVLSLDHTVDGGLVLDGEAVSFEGGRGYTEKDWGRSFPSAWVWVQCNGFDTPGTSLTASVARIPWLGSSFVGSIVGMLAGGRLYRFATYTGARLVSLEHSAGAVSFTVEDRTHRLEVRASGAVPGVLRSPVLGRMIGEVEESLQGLVSVRLTERRGGRVLFEGDGSCAGIELMDPEGDLAT
jgi:tocopherol cyclase